MLRVQISILDNAAASPLSCVRSLRVPRLFPAKAAYSSASCSAAAPRVAARSVPEPSWVLVVQRTVHVNVARAPLPGVPSVCLRWMLQGTGRRMGGARRSELPA
jgi:hypothetical protein